MKRSHLFYSVIQGFFTTLLIEMFFGYDIIQWQWWVWVIIINIILGLLYSFSVLYDSHNIN